MGSPETPKASIKALVFHPERELILALRRAKDQRWTLPGGGINDDETPRKALERELYEETGIHLNPDSPLKLLELQLFSYRSCQDQISPVARLIGYARALTSEVRLDTEHDKSLWIATNHLGRLSLETTLLTLNSSLAGISRAQQLPTLDPSEMPIFTLGLTD